MRTLYEVKVQGYPVRMEDDYVCLSDLAKSKAGSPPWETIRNWLRTKNTLEYIAVWEGIYNKNFKPAEFDRFKNASGNKSFSVTPEKLVEEAGVIGLYSRRGKDGAIFAHKDIALEFAAYISAKFKLYLIREFQRLTEENKRSANDIEWGVRRFLSKGEYRIQTDAVKEYKIPYSIRPQHLKFVEYTEEADMLNIAVFGFTAKQWREQNTDLCGTGNVRDYASANELIVLAGLEVLNAELIKERLPYNVRLSKLKESAKRNLDTHNRHRPELSLRKNHNGDFVPVNKGMFPDRKALPYPAA